MYKGLVLVFSSGLAWRVIIDLVTNGARGCLVWHVVYRAWRFNGSLRFRTRPIYVHTYFIRRPAAEYATRKPYGNLTRLSPSHESLACETNKNPRKVRSEGFTACMRQGTDVLRLVLLYTVKFSISHKVQQQTANSKSN